MLVGNKCDLPNRAVTYDEGMNYAKAHGLGYMEISAKTGQNVENTFQITVTNIHKNLHGDKDKGQEVVNNRTNPSQSVKIDSRSLKKKDREKKGCKC